MRGVKYIAPKRNAPRRRQRHPRAPRAVFDVFPGQHYETLPKRVASLFRPRSTACSPPPFGFGRASGGKGKRPEKCVSRSDPGCHSGVLRMSFTFPLPLGEPVLSAVEGGEGEGERKVVYAFD